MNPEENISKLEKICRDGEASPEDRLDLAKCYVIVNNYPLAGDVLIELINNAEFLDETLSLAEIVFKNLNDINNLALIYVEQAILLNKQEKHKESFAR